MAFTEYSVDSSLLEKVAYDPDNFLLRATFKDGTEYEYDGVLQEVFDALMEADSQGKFFYSNIRKSYPYTKIR